MLDAGLRTLVFSSSCATFGDQRTELLDESHPQAPVNPYGETKRVFEQALRWYGGAYGLRSVALRYFNAAGADPDGEVGEDHAPETHLIPLAIEAALGGKALQIYGTDYPTPDGTAIRDYIHVQDLADAHVAAVERLQGGAASLFANLGTGRGRSVREVIAAVETVSGAVVPAREAGRRAGDPPELVADARLAADVLGWTARLPDIEAMVAHAWRWRTRRPGA
jgi:UDP-arabinose 4-epimerase